MTDTPAPARPEITPETLAEWRKVAGAATPGPWRLEYSEIDIGPAGGPDTRLVALVLDEHDRCIVVDEEADGIEGLPSPDGEHIATACPTNGPIATARRRSQNTIVANYGSRCFVKLTVHMGCRHLNPQETAHEPRQ